MAISVSKDEAKIRGLFDAWTKAMEAKDSEHRDLEIAVDGDLAFAHCLHHVKPIGEDLPAGHWFRVTVCYRRIDGRWRVVHEHVSVPFDPTTGKVVFIEQVP